MDNEAGNQTTETQESQVQDLAGQTTEGGEGQAQEVYTPFKEGKEKFSIDGEEVEMTWDEVKKSVQLAKASYKRFEEANGIKQSATKFQEQMLHLAKTNPEGLIRVLNPNWQRGTPAQGTTQDAQRTTDQEQPWQSEIERLASQNEELAQKLEAIELEKERVALRQEFETVKTQYPIFKDKLALNYLQTEYRKALKSGKDLSLDDVAFYINQDLQKSKTAQVQSQQQKIQQRKAVAPVSNMPSGGEGKKEATSFEDLRKSLGMA